MALASDALTKRENSRIFREQILPEYDLDSRASQEKPRAVILGGQPGAGKGGLSWAASVELGDDVITVDPDELRDYHPNVEEFRRQNPITWSGRTHADAGAWAAELLEATVSERKNLIFDTTLSDGKWASESLIKDLQSKGYQVEVRVVATPLLESELGVDQRFTNQMDREGYGRHVPKGARDAIYSKIPASLDTIHADTDVVIRIFNREGKELYSSSTDPRPPGQALEQERNARLAHPEVSQRLRNDWSQQEDWHRHLPENAKSIPGMDADTQGRLLREQIDASSVQFAAIRAEGSATIDELVRPGAPPARAPVIEPEIPGLRRAGAAAGVAGLGVLASAYDAHETGQRVSALLQEQNAAAAQSELNHFAARGVGGWAGGALAASLVGSTGAGPLTLVAADAYLFSKAFEKAATLHDSNMVYHQRDKAGVDWEFNGRNWVREASLDRTQDGVDNPFKQDVIANYEKARELGAYASRSAVALALGKITPPQDPFNIPAQPRDQVGLDNQNWHRDPATDQWMREVKTGVAGANDRGIYASETATPERSRELSQEARSRIEENIANGREAVAASYLETHAALRSQDFIKEIPAAVEYAKAQNNIVLGSDNQLYRRTDTGEWVHNDEMAHGNLALELELTQQIRQPRLESFNERLAELQASPPPTPAQVERSELLHRYETYSVRLPHDWIPAIELANQRTRESNGIAGPTLQELQPGEMGMFSADSAIVHYQAGADGVAHPVATTSTEEIRQAYDALNTQRLAGPQVPETPALHIAALSPQERDAYQQAMSEANRQGGSAEQKQHVATLAAVNVHGSNPDLARAPQVQETDRARSAVPAPAAQEQAVRPSPAPMAMPPASEFTEQVQPPSSRDQVRLEVQASAKSDASIQKAAASEPPPAHERASPWRDPASEAQAANGVDTNNTHAGVQQTVHEPSEARGAQAVHVLQQVRERGDLPRDDFSSHGVEPPPVNDSAAGREQPAWSTRKLAEPEEPRSTEEMPAQVFAGATPSKSAQFERPGSTSAENGAAYVPIHQSTWAAPAPRLAERDHTSLDVDANPPDRKEPERHPAWPSKPDHPDYPLFQQIRDGVAAVDAEYGRTFDATSERMSASLFVLAKGNGLTRADHVVMSSATATSPEAEFVFLVEGDIGDPAGRRASMRTRQAVETPVEEAMQQLEAQNQEQQQLQAQQMEQQVQGQQAQLEANARVMTMDGDGGGGGGE